MTVERVAVVDCYDLENTIKNHFDLEEFDILRMFFEDAENGSYHSLDIDAGSVEAAYRYANLYTEWGYDELQIETQRMTAQMLEYLHELFPHDEMILVNVNW